MNFVFSRDNDLLSAQCWFKIFQIEQNNMKEICKTMTCIERKVTIKKKDISISFYFNATFLLIACVCKKICKNKYFLYF